LQTRKGSVQKYLCLFAFILITACQPQHTDKHQPRSNQQTNIIENFAAHWLTDKVIVIAEQYADDSLMLIAPALKSKTNWPLTAIEQPSWLAKQYPHLVEFKSYQINIEHPQIKQLLKNKLTVSNSNSDKKGTQLQTAGVIDFLFTSNDNGANEVTDYGASINESSIQFKLWAPTAQQVVVELFNQDKTPAEPNTLLMTEDTATGIWQANTHADLAGKYYRYRIKVYHPASDKLETLTTTDPYSLSLSTNSEYSHIVDLNDSRTMPEGWHSQKDNHAENPEDNIFYETHIRDFSAYEKALSNPDHRGKYLAFTDPLSDGVKYLSHLREAGINSIHLLPAFDIGTINENSQQVIDLNDTIERVCKLTAVPRICALEVTAGTTIQDYLSTLPKDSEQQQAIISDLRTFDNYNWGYDPFHYSVPEGSYAINPEGIDRIIEFRTMVQHLHNMGFRVIMDVVYNHTHQAALKPTAVLDKIVPNYYHRLDPITGDIAQSTCCDNTATEHVMMEKLMIDSLVVWARDYKIDGFRFDLMAHQPKTAMLKAREVIKKIDPDNYFYGEGWNFGEVANNQRFVQASQLELADTEIGTFTDRLRDAVRGGAFNAAGSSIRKSQGIGNGLATLPNELQSQDLSLYYAMADQLRIGLTGNLANYPLLTINNQVKLGREIQYGDQPAGYALDPADTINYVSKHDNQSLWDNNQYRIAYHLSTKQRVRMQLQSLSFAIFAQGIPFIHMGSELLRSKGFLRDSYDYSDWFNKVDFSMQDNNYNIGLPPADKDQQNWQIIKEIISSNAGKDVATPADIQFSSAVFIDYIKLRMSSKLFRLTNEQEIIDRIQFHNVGEKQKLGLFAMSIKGDQQSKSMMVVFNTAAQAQQIEFSDAKNYQLHPIQQQGSDPVVKNSQITNQAFIVPSLTTAIFIEK